MSTLDLTLSIGSLVSNTNEDGYAVIDLSIADNSIAITLDEALVGRVAGDVVSHVNNTKAINDGTSDAGNIVVNVS